MAYTKAQYKRAFEIACELMGDSILYGIDKEFIFDRIMERDGCVASFDYQEFILTHLDRFSDDDVVRHKAIERLGW